MRWLPSRIALRTAAFVGALGAAASAVPLPEVALPDRRRATLDCCGGRVRVTLLGVHHASEASVGEARAVVGDAIRRGSLAAVALESDDETLAVQRAASGALAGLSGAAIRRDGVRAVQGALFELPLVRARLGAALAAPEQIALSAELRRSLRAGHVHGREMAAAADLAERGAVRVVCIDSAPAAKAAAYAGAAQSDAPSLWRAVGAHVGQACELRARALLRGGRLSLDDQLGALRRFKPATYRAAVEARDAEMSSAVRALCAELARAAGGAGAPGGDDGRGGRGPAEVVVLCGAAHLPGLEAGLRAGGCAPCCRDEPPPADSSN